MNFKHLVLTFVFLSATLAFAEPNVEQNSTTQSIEDKNRLKINALLIQKEALEEEIIDNNIWSKIYSNYHTYQELKEQEETLNAKIKRLVKMKKLTKKQKKQLENYESKKVTLLSKLQLLKEYEKDPFKKFLTPPAIGDVPTVENPFAIIGALSFREKLESDREEYNSRYYSLQSLMKKFEEGQVILKKLLKLDPENPEYIKENKGVEDQIKTFIPVLEIFKTTKNVYSKKIDEIELNIKNDVKREIGKSIATGRIILFFIFLLFL